MELFQRTDQDRVHFPSLNSPLSFSTSRLVCFKVFGLQGLSNNSHTSSLSRLKPNAMVKLKRGPFIRFSQRKQHKKEHGFQRKVSNALGGRMDKKGMIHT